MKKYKIKHIILVIMLIPVLLISLSYGNYTKNNVKEDCSYNVEKYLEDIHNQDGSILLNSYLDFDYDGFYIIGPYASSETKHETVGQKWYNYSSYPSYLFNEILLDGDTTDEILQQLVFMKDERIINVATVQRKDGDFVHLEKTYYKTDQVFSNTKNIHEDNEIVEYLKIEN